MYALYNNVNMVPELELSSEEVDLGDNLTFKLHAKEHDIKLPNTAPWKVYKLTSSGLTTPVTSHAALMMIEVVPKGSTKEWEWKAKTSASGNEAQITKGTYKIEVETCEETLSKKFEVV